MHKATIGHRLFLQGGLRFLLKLQLSLAFRGSSSLRFLWRFYNHIFSKGAES